MLEPRQVVEEVSFSESVESLAIEFPALMWIRDAIIWTIARDPFAGTRIPSSEPRLANHFVFKTTETGGTPAFRVVYRYNEKADPERVFLLGIDAVEQIEPSERPISAK